MHGYSTLGQHYTSRCPSTVRCCGHSTDCTKLVAFSAKIIELLIILLLMTYKNECFDYASYHDTSFVNLLWPSDAICDKDLGQYLIRKWLVARWHQAITWTDVDLSSMGLHGIYLRSISLAVLKISVCEICLENILVELLPHPPGANELIRHTQTMANYVHTSSIPRLLLPSGRLNIKMYRDPYVKDKTVSRPSYL